VEALSNEPLMHLCVVLRQVFPSVILLGLKRHSMVLRHWSWIDSFARVTIGVLLHGENITKIRDNSTTKNCHLFHTFLDILNGHINLKAVWKW
jgi:hypothetical protein